MKRSTAAISLAISASVILSGCSNSGDEITDASSVTAGAAESASPEPVEISVTIPKVADCWDQTNMDNWVLEGTLTNCVSEHNGQTIWVGELPDTVLENPFTVMEGFKAVNAGADGKVDWDSINDRDRAEYDTQLALLDTSFSECKTELNEVIGANSPDGSTMTTIFSTDETGPSQSEWDEGARWIRCNATAKVPVNEGEPSAGLMQLPEDLYSVMLTDDGRQFNYCWKNGDTGTERAICGTPKAKQMFLTLSSRFPQADVKPWVSKKWADKQAKDFCNDAVRPYMKSNKAKYRYWGLYENSAEARVRGFSKATWGTDKATFACAINQGSYGFPQD